MSYDEKRCRWCGGRFFRRENERPSAFARREHCDRSCQVSTQNSRRAQRTRSADPWPDTEDAAAVHYAACNPEPGDPS